MRRNEGTLVYCAQWPRLGTRASELKVHYNSWTAWFKCADDNRPDVLIYFIYLCPQYNSLRLPFANQPQRYLIRH